MKLKILFLLNEKITEIINYGKKICDKLIVFMNMNLVSEIFAKIIKFKY